MIGREWYDVAREADELLAEFHDKPPEWWAAFNAAIAMHTHDRVMEIGLDGGDKEDDEPWKRR